MTGPTITMCKTASRAGFDDHVIDIGGWWTRELSNWEFVLRCREPPRFRHATAGEIAMALVTASQTSVPTRDETWIRYMLEAVAPALWLQTPVHDDPALAR